MYNKNVAHSVLLHTYTQKGKNMDTNPYQLRFDLLTMAKDLLMEEWYAKRQVLDRQFEENVRARSDGSRRHEPVQVPETPEIPSVNKIMELAGELNGFVSRKG